MDVYNPTSKSWRGKENQGIDWLEPCMWGSGYTFLFFFFFFFFVFGGLVYVFSLVLFIPAQDSTKASE